ncbi:MAG: periplasmic heavy metal sensor [Desulfobulbaceae bacterium]|nr:periplasmic heavy metal sensor [Desulfobulbaceae bacterium]
MKNNALRHLLLISVVLNLAILGTVGYRYYQKAAYWISPFGHTIKKNHFLFEELALQSTQTEAMRKRAMPFRAEIDRQRADIAKQRKNLVTLMRQEQPDMTAIGVQIAGISTVQEAMQRKVVTHLLEEKALLDKEQQGKFFDLIENAMNQGSQTGCPGAE